MKIILHEDTIEEMTYHTETPEAIYDALLGTLKPEILNFIKHVVEQKSHYPTEAKKPTIEEILDAI